MIEAKLERLSVLRSLFAGIGCRIRPVVISWPWACLVCSIDLHESRREMGW